MAKRARYSATDENLLNHALEPAMRWLIAVALDGSTITYGDVKEKLEKEESFSTVFATRIGLVAGELMHKLQSVEPNAPLINVLVVNQEDRQPSKGAGSFMANRFGNERLRAKSAKKRYPKLWKRSFERAAGEVYEYSEKDWADLYRRVFKRRLTIDNIEHERKERQQGSEKDGFQYGRGGGEGPFHKALRLWVTDNPQAVRRGFAGARAETEVDLDSGDRIDAVYYCADQTIVLEVKSRISNEVDLKRGVYQCIKYRAVKKAMDVRDDAIVEAYLVTENDIPGEIAALLKRHKIRHYQAAQVRK